MTFEATVRALPSGPLEMRVERDRTVSLARVRLGGETVYEGNYGDFYPGCYGGWSALEDEQGRWRGVEGFAATLRQAVEARGRAVFRTEGTYVYLR